MNTRPIFLLLLLVITGTLVESIHAYPNDQGIINDPKLSDFDTIFSTRPIKIIYPSENGPKALGCQGAAVSDWMASSYIVTKLENPSESLDIDETIINQTTGKILLHPDIDIVSFGGPLVNPLVKYAESNKTSTEDRAPIAFNKGPDTCWFSDKYGNKIPQSDALNSQINTDRDIFVIELYRDGEGRAHLYCYGYGWKGTYAAGKYFHSKIYRSNEYSSKSWIIVSWEDSNNDGFVNAPNDGDNYTVIASDFENIYFANINSNNLNGYYLIQYDSVPGTHSILYSKDPNFTTQTRSTWDNNTATPKIYINSEQIPFNETIYFRPEIYDSNTGSLIMQGETHNFSITQDAGVIFTGFQYITASDNLGYNPRGTVFYDPDTLEYYLLSSEESNGDNLNLKTSSQGIKWINHKELINGTIITTPPGYSQLKTPTMIKVNQTYVLYCGAKETQTGNWITCLWTGNQLTEMSYQGKVTDEYEVPEVSENFRVFDAWYNQTDKNYYAFIGGGDKTHGDWHIFYLAKSIDLNFTGDVINTALMNGNSFAHNSWADTYNYPPRGVWDNNRSSYIGLMPGCGSTLPPYEFDNDLVTLEKPSLPFTQNNLYTDMQTGVHGYGETILLRTDPNKHSIVLVDNELYLFQFEYNSEKVYLYNYKAFFENQTIRISEGSTPKTHYDGWLPSMSMIKNPLPINMLVNTGSSKLNIEEYNSTKEYVKIRHTEYEPNQRFYINIRDLSMNELYLHISLIGSDYIVEINSTPSNAVDTISPAGNGDDFLFSYILE